MSRRTIANSLAFKALLSAIIIAVLVSRMDMQILDHLFAKIRAQTWVYAIALLFTQMAALAWRWHILVNIGAARLSYPDSLRITLAGTLANFLFITSIGGIVARIALTIQHGSTLLKAAAATVIDRLMTLAALVIVAAAFFPVLGQTLDPKLFHSTLMFLSAIVASALIFLFLVIIPSRRNIILKNRKIAFCYSYLRRIAKNPSIMAGLLSSSLLAQLSYFFAAYLVATSMGEPLPFMTFMAVMPMIALIASIPVGYGSWGIREGAFVYGLGLIGITAETAFMISVQIGLLSIITAVIAGVPALMSSPAVFDLSRLTGRKKVTAPLHVKP